VLALPDIGSPYVLHTDANSSTVAATLGQMHEGKVEHPIAFASQKLSGSQLGWTIIEKEAYAIIWALIRFRDIVYGAHITVRCDHNPLQYNIIKTKLESVSLSCKSHRSKTANIKILSANSTHRR